MVSLTSKLSRLFLPRTEVVVPQRPLAALRAISTLCSCVRAAARAAPTPLAHADRRRVLAVIRRWRVFFLAGRDPRHHDRSANHVGGAVLAFGAAGISF